MQQVLVCVCTSSLCLLIIGCLFGNFLVVPDEFCQVTIHTWKQYFTNHLMVVVDPCQLFIGEQSRVNGFSLVRYEGDWLVDGISVSVVLHQNFVLNTNTELVIDVYARLVGHNHARTNGNRSRYTAKDIRTFVDAEQVTHTVGQTVLKVQTYRSHRCTGDGIQVDSVHSRSQHGIVHCQMSLENIGIVINHFLSQRSNGDGTGNIRGTVCVMTTGVQKQEAFRQDFGIGFRCRCVVDDGTVWSVSGNGLKGQIEEAILFGTELPQLFCRTEFGLMRCLCSIHP